MVYVMTSDSVYNDVITSIVYNLRLINCWQYFSTLDDITMYNSPPNEELIHSDYKFGDCNRPYLQMYTHIHKEHMDVLGKIIIREWINVPRIPVCIVLRARSFDVDMFRSTAFNFQICVPRIVYCHSQKRIKYYYYEWYLPTEMVGGMNWDLYFYGSGHLTWQ